MRFSPGCKCCACDKAFFTYGCAGVGVPGRAITVTQAGDTKGTCTTADGTGGTTLGGCVISLPPGTYDYSIAGGDGFAGATGSFIHTCPSAAATSVNLSPASTHVCIPDACNYPIPKTLTSGSHTLTYAGHIAGPTESWKWDVTESFSASTKVADPLNPGFCVNGSGSLPVNYSLTYIKGLLIGWMFGVGWNVQCCEDGNAHYSETGSPGGVSSGVVANPGPCHPVAFSFSVPTTGSYNCGVPNTLGTPGGGGTVLVTA